MYIITNNTGYLNRKANGKDHQQQNTTHDIHIDTTEPTLWQRVYLKFLGWDGLILSRQHAYYTIKMLEKGR